MNYRQLALIQCLVRTVLEQINKIDELDRSKAIVQANTDIRRAFIAITQQMEAHETSTD